MTLANRSTRATRISKQTQSKKQKKHGGTPLPPTAEVIDLQGMKFEAERDLPPIKPLTPRQAEYLHALRTSD